MSTDSKRRGTPKRKRVPPENRFVQAKKKRELEQESVSGVNSVTDRSIEPEISSDQPSFERKESNATPTLSRSEKKIHNIYKLLDDSSGESGAEQSGNDSEYSDNDLVLDQEENLEGNRIIDVEILNQNMMSQLVCGLCHSNVSLIELDRKGLASKFAFHCSNVRCSGGQSFPSCEQIDVGNLQVSSVNHRAALAMRCIGSDHADLCTFCGVMNLPPPAAKSTHQHIKKTIEKAAVEVMNDSMSNAAAQEYEMADIIENDDVRSIDVSCDGTWMTRGHSSKVGAAIVIGCTTGKVLGVGTRSKVCKSCEHYDKLDKNTAKYRQWHASHAQECTNNHDGSSGSMEKEIVKDIFCSSLDQHKLRYTRFIGDGDTNSFKTVSDAQPYGPNFPVEKIECVGHIQKRMGTRLRQLKRNLGDGKLEDGKSNGGKTG